MNTNNNKQNTAAVGLSKLIKPALNFAVKGNFEYQCCQPCWNFSLGYCINKKGSFKKVFCQKTNPLDLKLENNSLK